MEQHSVDTLHSLFLKLLNGLQIRYGLDDLVSFLKFSTISFSQESESNQPLVPLKLRVVVVSLPFRLDRRLQIVTQFERLGIPFEFFDAIHGKSQKLKAYDVINFSRLSKNYLSPGSIGCIASHISIWKELIASTDDCFLILEDDVILEKNLVELKLLFDKLPVNTDIAYLGSGSTKSWINMKRVSDSFAKCFSVRKGAYGYILYKRGAIKLLKNISKVNIVCGGIDSLLGITQMRHQLCIYHFLPSICNVNGNSPSNIFNLSNKSKVIHKSEFK